MYNKGEFIFVEDRGDDYKCKVVQVKDDKLKVHYVGWSSSRDEWLEQDSLRINRFANKEDSFHSLAELECFIDDVAAKVARTKNSSDEISEVEDQPRSAAEQLSQEPDAVPLSIPEATGQPANDVSAVEDAVQAASGNVDVECRLCHTGISGRSVSCRGCKGSFHPDSLCLGVGGEVVSVLLESYNGSVAYYCCDCRLGDDELDDNRHAFRSVIDQLAKTVGELAREIKLLKQSEGRNTLSSESRAVNASSNNLEPRISPLDLNSGSYQVDPDIMEHIREFKEREKRVDSIVLRGLGNVHLDEVRTKFSHICRLLRLEPITLTNLQRVGSTSVYRGRISDGDKRRELLLNAHKLRHTAEFSHVFVNRDLTLVQRREIVSRRRARRTGIGTSARESGGVSNGAQVDGLGSLGMSAAS